MKNKIQSKLNEIAQCVIDGINNNSVENTNGLYDGQSGILLFLYYFARYSKNDDIKSFADNYAENILDNIWIETTRPTFCSGLSGILYLFDFLKEQQFLDVDMNDVENEFNDYFIHCMNRFIADQYYDFMHGALGIGFYFIKHGKNKMIPEMLIDFLYETAEKDFENNIFKWKSTLNENKEFGYNIALSHGISGIVLFLSQAIKKGLENDKLPLLLEGAINYIFSQEIDPYLYGSYFPSKSLGNKDTIITKSRLGWCYGDLGIAYAICYAGSVLNKKEWINKGIKILLHSTERKNLIKNHVKDAGLCHGCTGVSMIYNSLYIKSSDSRFLDASNYWLEQSLLLSVYSDGLAGYKTLVGLNESICDYSLLTGISGIGLMYISYLLMNKQEWGELFLLF